jgi:hypothetical protein
MNAPPIPQKALTLSCIVDECKPLVSGPKRVAEAEAKAKKAGDVLAAAEVGRCRLNLSNPS